jgi:hypothetical protein
MIKEKKTDTFEEHSEYFSNLYASGGWGYISSGGGSSLENTVEYRKFLQEFIKENKIKKVYDFGCGDWTFSKHINWSGVTYNGIETVQFLVDSLEKYKKTNIKFHYMKTPKNFYSKKGDLLLLKDILQHWNNKEITTFLDQVSSNFKYIIITNSCVQQEDWEDLENRFGGRPLSCMYYPLKKYNIEHLFNVSDKEVSLIVNEDL